MSNEKFKPIQFDELGLNAEDMRKIAEGAKLYMQPEIADETETASSDAPAELVTRRNLKD